MTILKITSSWTFSCLMVYSYCCFLLSLVMASVKTVLVSLEDRARVVTFSGGRQELLVQVQSKFSDILLYKGEGLYLQVSFGK